MLRWKSFRQRIRAPQEAAESTFEMMDKVNELRQRGVKIKKKIVSSRIWDALEDTC